MGGHGRGNVCTHTLTPCACTCAIGGVTCRYEKLLAERKEAAAKKFQENAETYEKHMKVLRKKAMDNNPNWKMPSHEDL